MVGNVEFRLFEGDLHQLTKGMKHSTKQARSEIKEKDLHVRSDKHLNIQVFGFPVAQSYLLTAYPQFLFLGGHL